MDLRKAHRNYFALDDLESEEVNNLQARPAYRGNKPDLGRRSYWIHRVLELGRILRLITKCVRQILSLRGKAGQPGGDAGTGEKRVNSRA